MTYVYRIFGRDELLYVGIADNFLSRFKQHEATKAWFDRATRFDIEEHPSRYAALDAERIVIRTELPVFNVNERPTDDEVWDLLSEQNADLYDYIEGNAASIEKHFVNQRGLDYCRVDHSRAIVMDARRFCRSTRHPAFKATRAYNLIISLAIAQMTDDCDFGCECSQMVDA